MINSGNNCGLLWQDVVTELNLPSDVPVSVVKNAWRALRDAYRKRMRLIAPLNVDLSRLQFLDSETDWRDSNDGDDSGSCRTKCSQSMDLNVSELPAYCASPTPAQQSGKPAVNGQQLGKSEPNDVCADAVVMNYSHLLNPALVSNKAQQWLEEDCVALDVGGAVGRRHQHVG